MMEQKTITFEKELSKVKLLLEKDSLNEDEQYYLTSLAKNLGFQQILLLKNVASKETEHEYNSLMNVLQRSSDTNTKNFIKNTYNDLFFREIQKYMSNQSQANNSDLLKPEKTTNQKIITTDEELPKILNILNKNTLSEDEQYYLTSFAKNLGLRQILYNNNITSSEMDRELKNIIYSLPTNKDTAAKSIFFDTYFDFYLKEIQNNISTQSQGHSNGSRQEKSLTRVRTDGIHTSSSNDDDYVQNGASGFTNILLIIITAITCGIFLGIILISYLNLH